MMGITFESANRRSWSNPFLDLLEGTVLLLGQYETRPEAGKFRRRYEILLEEYSREVVDTTWASQLRRLVLSSGFGSSRDLTVLSLVSIVAEVISRVVSLIQELTPAGQTYIDQWSRNPSIAAWLEKLFDLVEYPELTALSSLAKSFTEEQLGQAQGQDETPSGAMASFDEESLIAGLKYIEGVVELCWSHGLRSGLAPCFLAIGGLQRISEKGASTPDPTPDGVLGPIFPEVLITSAGLKSQATGRNEKKYPEWLLLIMSLSELYGELGSGLYLTARNSMEHLGYKSGHRWQDWTFKALFDRLSKTPTPSLLSLKVKYQKSVDSISDQTERLVSVLKLDPPPRAPRIR